MHALKVNIHINLGSKKMKISNYNNLFYLY